MRVVRVELLCGWHSAVKDEAVEAVTEYTVTVRGVGRSRPKMVAVCQDCADAWMGPLLAAIETEPDVDSVTEPARQPTSRSLPRPRVGRPAVDLPLRCPEGCIRKRRGDGDDRVGEPYEAPNRSALSQHMKKKHGKQLNDYDWSQIRPREEAAP